MSATGAHQRSLSKRSSSLDHQNLPPQNYYHPLNFVEDKLLSSLAVDVAVATTRNANIEMKYSFLEEKQRRRSTKQLQGELLMTETSAASYATTADQSNIPFLEEQNNNIPNRIRHRNLNIQDDILEECQNDALQLFKDNSDNNNGKLLLERESDCKPQSTSRGRCTYTYPNVDWKSYEQNCTDLDGITNWYEDLTITCNSRSDRRQNGALSIDTFTYFKTAECFPKESCGSLFSKTTHEEFCTKNLDNVVKSWENAYRRSEKGYYYVKCFADFDDCNTNAKMSIGTIIGITLGSIAAAVFVLLLAFILYKRNKRMKASNDGEEEDDDEEENNKDSKTASDYLAANVEHDARNPREGLLKQLSIIPADAEPLTLKGNNGEEEASGNQKRLAQQAEAENNAKSGDDDDGGASSGGPKESFGALRGCLRDGHFKHTVLWLGNVVYLCFWFYYVSVGCEPRSSRSDDCSTSDPGWWWNDFTGLVIFIYSMLYGFFIWEFWGSSTRKYLLNVNTSESLIDYMNRLYRTEPTLSLTMECYHYETRTVTYTDSNGNMQTRTETYPVVTYTESEVVHILTWEDESVRLCHKHVSEYQVTKLVLTKSFVGDENFNQQRGMLISRNRHRDVYYNLITNYNITGFTDRMLSYVNLEKKPWLLTSSWCYFFHFTVFLALPYRIWMSSICGKVEANVHKRLTTSRNPHCKDEDNEDNQANHAPQQETTKTTDSIDLPTPTSTNDTKEKETSTNVEAPFIRSARRPSGGLDNTCVGQQLALKSTSANDSFIPPTKVHTGEEMVPPPSVEASYFRPGRRPSSGLENRGGSAIPESTCNVRTNANLQPYVVTQRIQKRLNDSDDLSIVYGTPITEQSKPVDFTSTANNNIDASSLEATATTIKVTAIKKKTDDKLGVKLDRDDDGIFTINRISKASPFQNSGLKVGVRVMAINGIGVTGKKKKFVNQILKSSVGRIALETMDHIE